MVAAELKKFLTSTKRAEKEQAKRLMEKVVGASRTRLAARQQRDNQRRKNALESSALPAKLADCRATDNERTELFIVEGDSALGTAKLARNSEFQALLPIRGKILNVQKASVGDMLKNAECSSIIQVVGAGSGRTFELDARRYGRIIFMADADSDGAHIRCLLATLFYKYMPELITSGRVFTAVPPLHRIELTNPKKGQEKYVYTYSDAELQRKLAELAKKGLRWKDPVQRYKGLGEMDAKQLAETTMDPRHRTLRRITVDSAESASAVFELLMGSDVAPAQGVPRPGRLRRRRRGARRLSDVRGRPPGAARRDPCTASGHRAAMDLVDRMGWSCTGERPVPDAVAAVGSELVRHPGRRQQPRDQHPCAATLVLACLGIVLVANGFVLLGSPQRPARGCRGTPATR